MLHSPKVVFVVVSAALFAIQFNDSKDADEEKMEMKAGIDNLGKALSTENQKKTNLRKNRNDIKKNLESSRKDYEDTKANLIKDLKGNEASRRENDFKIEEITRDIETKKIDVDSFRAAELSITSPLSSNFWLEFNALFTKDYVGWNLCATVAQMLGADLTLQYLKGDPSDHEVVRAMDKIGANVANRGWFTFALVVFSPADTTTEDWRTWIVDTSYAGYMNLLMHVVAAFIILLCVQFLGLAKPIGSSTSGDLVPETSARQFLVVNCVTKYMQKLPSVFVPLFGAGATISCLWSGPVAVGFLQVHLVNFQLTIVNMIPECVYFAVEPQFLLTFFIFQLMRVLNLFRAEWPRAVVNALSKQTTNVDLILVFVIHLVAFYMIFKILQLMGALRLKFRTDMPIVEWGKVSIKCYNVMAFPLYLSLTLLVKNGDEILIDVQTQIYIKQWGLGYVTFIYDNSSMTKYIKQRGLGRVKNVVLEEMVSSGMVSSGIGGLVHGFFKTDDSIHCELSTTGFFGKQLRINIDQATLMSSIMQPILDQLPQERVEVGARQVETAVVKKVVQLHAQAKNYAETTLWPIAAQMFTPPHEQDNTPAPSGSTDSVPPTTTTESETEEDIMVRQALHEVSGATSTTSTTSTTTLR